MLSNIASNSHARGSTNTSADLLNRHHEWVAEQHGPGNSEAELSTRLAVGRYSTRIVVGCSRDQSWSERLQPRLRRPNLPPFLLLRGGGRCHVKNPVGEKVDRMVTTHSETDAWELLFHPCSGRVG